MIFLVHSSKFYSATETTVKKWGDAILVSGHLPQYRSTATDGDYYYNGAGPKKSMRARMVNPKVGVGDATHVMIHDLAHCDDLLIEDAHRTDPYVKNTIHPERYQSCLFPLLAESSSAAALDGADRELGSR